MTAYLVGLDPEITHQRLIVDTSDPNGSRKTRVRIQKAESYGRCIDVDVELQDKTLWHVTAIYSPTVYHVAFAYHIGMVGNTNCCGSATVVFFKLGMTSGTILEAIKATKSSVIHLIGCNKSFYPSYHPKTGDRMICEMNVLEDLMKVNSYKGAISIEVEKISDVEALLFVTIKDNDAYTKWAST